MWNWITGKLNCYSYKTILQLRLSEEWQLLGQQKLTEFRDSISCPSDKVVPGDFSDYLDLPQDVKTKVSTTITEPPPPPTPTIKIKFETEKYIWP